MADVLQGQGSSPGGGATGSALERHTSGPWVVSPGHTTVYPRDDGALAVGRHYVALTTTDTRNAEVAQQARADARLIAAAPELLEAARNLRVAQRAYMADRGNDTLGKCVAGAAEKLDAAIAKAEGR